MHARDLMQTDVLLTREDETVSELCDRMQAAHVHSAPVVDEGGYLIGIVSLEDILFGGVMSSRCITAANWDDTRRVREIMTAPALCTEKETTAEDVCEMMWRYRVHHLPVVVRERVVGIISSLDVCRVVIEQARDTYPPSFGVSAQMPAEL